MKKLLSALSGFFFPAPGSRWTVRILPYATMGALTLAVLVGSAYTWDYTNSPGFCGTSCHTMPPEYSSYQISPHARIACVECHIGREFIGNQLTRKAGDIKHVIDLVFTRYEYPIRAKSMRPAPQICERCHSPEKFSDDSLTEIKHYANDEANTPTSIYLVLKTGGGSKRQGLGKGIHWHIENNIQYFPSDKLQQEIPYVRVTDENGNLQEYVDLESDFDPTTLDETKLVRMDCVTCHNRITHLVMPPGDAVDAAIARQVIDPSIPYIRLKALESLLKPYQSREEAAVAIGGLEDFYRVYYPDFYNANKQLVKTSIAEVQAIYANSVYPEQKADWYSHPNNKGHKDFPGCFRCHDGKHMNADQQPIRLECNLCHSIPVVAGVEAFVSNIEINRGLEPESHTNANWIGLHRDYLNYTCEACHNTADPGGVSNTSFCSNSACHGSSWSFAGFDAPAVRQVWAEQLKLMPTPPPPPVASVATYEGLRPVFEARCGMCHGANKAGGLVLITYEGIMAGSKSGPIIVSARPDESLLVQIQSEKHFANLNKDDLALVKKWIEAGAPEK